MNCVALKLFISYPGGRRAKVDWQKGWPVSWWWRRRMSDVFLSLITPQSSLLTIELMELTNPQPVVHW